VLGKAPGDFFRKINYLYDILLDSFIKKDYFSISISYNRRIIIQNMMYTYIVRAKIKYIVA